MNYGIKAFDCRFLFKIIQSNFKAKSRDSEFEVIPWGHCDQIFIKSNYTFGETDLAKAGSFIERHNTLIKSSGWFLAPPFSTRIPLHLWEFEINNLMWHMKTRLARAAFDVSYFFQSCVYAI